MLHALMTIFKYYSTLHERVRILEREAARERLKASLATEEFNHAYRKLTSEEREEAYAEFVENEKFFNLTQDLS